LRFNQTHLAGRGQIFALPVLAVVVEQIKGVIAPHVDAWTAIFEVCQGAKAVPLNLIDPVGMGNGLGERPTGMG